MARPKKVSSERILEVSQHAMGTEPKFADKQVTSENARTLLMTTLSWYARESTPDKSKEYFLSNTDAAAEYKELPAYEFGNAGFLYRMVSRGFPEKYINTGLKRKTAYLRHCVVQYQKAAEIEAANAKPKVPVVDTVLLDCLETVDHFVDSYIGGNGKTLDIDITRLSKPQQNKVKTYISAQLAELELAYKEKNQDGEAAYSLTGSQCKQMSTKFREILNVLNISTVRKPRKARTPKAKPVSKIVQNVKYCIAFNEFKGLSPEKIIGANQLLAYNTKSRKVAIYYASSDGFTFKGTTLQNVIGARCKTLRKPDEQLKLLMESAKGQVVKVFDKIAAVVYDPSNRINDEIVLLKVWN